MSDTIQNDGDSQMFGEFANNGSEKRHCQWLKQAEKNAVNYIISCKRVNSIPEFAPIHFAFCIFWEIEKKAVQHIKLRCNWVKESALVIAQKHRFYSNHSHFFGHVFSSSSARVCNSHNKPLYIMSSYSVRDPIYLNFDYFENVAAMLSGATQYGMKTLRLK